MVFLLELLVAGQDINTGTELPKINEKRLAECIAHLPIEKYSSTTAFYVIFGIAKVVVKSSNPDVKSILRRSLVNLSKGQNRVSMAVRSKASEMLRFLNLDKETLSEVFEPVMPTDLLPVLAE